MSKKLTCHHEQELRNLKRKRRVERAALKMFIDAFGPVERKTQEGAIPWVYYTPAGVIIKAEVVVTARAALRGKKAHK